MANGDSQYAKNLALSRDLEGFSRDLAQLRKDMYFGNGKPGITTRVQVLEDCAEELEKKVNELREALKNQSREFTLAMSSQITRFDSVAERQDKKIDSLAKYVWMGVGIMAALEVVLKFVGGK